MKRDALPLTFSESGHRYTLDGKQVPSVTTIVDAGIPKPALKRWGERVVAEAAVDHVEDVRRMLSTMGRQSAIDSLAAVPYERMKTAQVRGTAVHALAEALISNEPVEVPAELEAYVRGYIAFLEAYDVEPLATEAMIANRTLWYAGKFDLLAVIRNEVWLLDIKTSKNVYPETALQCAAYAGAELCVVDNELVEFPRIDAIGVVHVTELGTTFYDLGDISAAQAEFAACLVTYNGAKRRKKVIDLDSPAR
jgi:hypothetical protein